MELPQLNKPTHEGIQLQPVKAPRSEDLGGLFRALTTLPAVPARKISEQIVIADGVPYIYSQEDGWVRMSGAVIYCGIVESDGTAISLPAGWSSAKNSTGSYTITHNLGTTSWVATPVISSSSLLAAQVGADGAEANTLDVFTFRTDTRAQADGRFMFTLIIHDN